MYEYKYIITVPKAIDMEEGDFNNLLCDYINKRYKTEFGIEKPVRSVGNENCQSYEEII